MTGDSRGVITSSVRPAGVAREVPPRLLEQVAGGLSPDGISPRAEPAQDLFRAEALNARADLRLGRPIGLLPISWGAIGLFLLALLTAVAVLLVTGTYTRKETGRGILRPASGESRILAPEAGIVTYIGVSEGDIVPAGHVLAVISTERVSIGGGSADSAILTSLEAEERSLRARLDAGASSASLDTNASASRVQSLEAERRAVQAAAGAARERLQLADEALRLALPVAERGYLSREDIRRREEAVIVQKQALADVEGRIESISAQIAETRTLAARRPFTAIAERGQIEDRLAAIAKERAQLAMRRGYAIRAPLPGRVTALQASRGRMTTDQPLMSIVPQGVALVAEVYLPSTAIGFLKPEQRVRLMFDAFPFERFGALQGRVTTISHTILRPDEVGAAVKVEEPVYRVLVALDQQALSAFGRPIPLQSGMALSADVVIEMRSFADWLFEPLLAMRGRL